MALLHSNARIQQDTFKCVCVFANTPTVLLSQFRFLFLAVSLGRKRSVLGYSIRISTYMTTMTPDYYGLWTQ